MDGPVADPGDKKFIAPKLHRDLYVRPMKQEHKREPASGVWAADAWRRFLPRLPDAIAVRVLTLRTQAFSRNSRFLRSLKSRLQGDAVQVATWVAFLIFIAASPICLAVSGWPC